MLQDLLTAEKNASILFEEAVTRSYVTAGQTEKELNIKLFNLAWELFGIRTYWHKRIVRSGINTLCPYKENPENLLLKDDDILFFDFGPVFEAWEADFGRTYVIGGNPMKERLRRDVESAWYKGRYFIEENFEFLTGADVFYYTRQLAKEYGWEHVTEHCGHLIGNFPHEKLQGDELTNYLHPQNDSMLSAPDRFGNKRYWIYEIHFADRGLQIGGFFEQLLAF